MTFLHGSTHLLDDGHHQFERQYWPLVVLHAQDKGYFVSISQMNTRSHFHAKERVRLHSGSDAKPGPGNWGDVELRDRQVAVPWFGFSKIGCKTVDKKNTDESSPRRKGDPALGRHRSKNRL